MGPRIGDVGEPRAVRAVRAELPAHRVGRGVGLRGGRFGRAPRAPGAALVVPAHPLSRMMRAARLRDVRSPERRARRRPWGAVDAAAGGVYLGGRRGRLGVAQVARARRPLPPCAVALPGDMEGRAHLGYAPGAPVEQDGSEPRPLRPRAYGCLPVRKALAFKIISFSLFGRSFSRPSPRRSYATWKGLPPCRRLRGVGPPDPVRQAPRVDAGLAGGLRVGTAPLPVQPHRLLLEPCRMPGRRMSHPMPPFPVYGIMPKRNSMCQRKRGRFRFRSKITTPSWTSWSAGVACGPAVPVLPQEPTRWRTCMGPALPQRPS